MYVRLMIPFSYLIAIQQCHPLQNKTGNLLSQIFPKSFYIPLLSNIYYHHKKTLVWILAWLVSLKRFDKCAVDEARNVHSNVTVTIRRQQSCHTLAVLNPCTQMSGLLLKYFSISDVWYLLRVWYNGPRYLRVSKSNEDQFAYTHSLKNRRKFRFNIHKISRLTYQGRRKQLEELNAKSMSHLQATSLPTQWHDMTRVMLSGFPQARCFTDVLL